MCGMNRTFTKESLDINENLTFVDMDISVAYYNKLFNLEAVNYYLDERFIKGERNNLVYACFSKDSDDYYCFENSFVNS